MRKFILLLLLLTVQTATAQSGLNINARPATWLRLGSERVTTDDVHIVYGICAVLFTVCSSIGIVISMTDRNLRPIGWLSCVTVRVAVVGVNTGYNLLIDMLNVGDTRMMLLDYVSYRTMIRYMLRGYTVAFIIGDSVSSVSFAINFRDFARAFN